MIRWSLPFVCRLRLNLPTSSTFNYANLTRNIATTSALCQGTPAQNEKLKIAEAQARMAKPNFNIGTIGHVDHGKTTLTAAITKYLSEKGLAKFVDFAKIDKAPEEQRRGITINIAHVGYESPKGERRYSHTDCPGHRDYVKNMISGTAQMDAAILVIGADDGVMAQTREHVLLAKQIGIKQLIVFLNKIDKVDQDTIELVEIETRELIEEFGFDGEQTPIIKGSALSALEGKDTSSIEQLLEAIDAIPLPERDQDKPFAMPLTAHVNTPKGVVLVGTVEKGTAKKGDRIEIKGFNKFYKGDIVSIQMFNTPVLSVKAGDHCGIMVKGMTKDMELHKGMVAGKSGTVQVSNALGVEFYLLSEEESKRKVGIRSGFTDDIHCGLWRMPGRIMFDQAILMPGEHASAKLYLQKQQPVSVGAHFIMRYANDQDIGHGIITKVYSSVDYDKLVKKLKAEKKKKEQEKTNKKK